MGSESLGNQTIKEHECLLAWASGQNSSTCSTVDITSIKLEKLLVLTISQGFIFAENSFHFFFFKVIELIASKKSFILRDRKCRWVAEKLWF